ncbi:MAG: ABC-F family ATP-binding cassette domain-containing protein [Sphingobium sp.]
MSCAIILSGIALSTPDGAPLLTDLDISFAAERTGLIGRNGVGKSSLLRVIAGIQAPARGTVAINGTIAMLRQIVQVAPGETIADLFGVTDAIAILRRAEAGEATVEELGLADWTLEERLAAALDKVGLPIAPDTRLATLSGGQRTRAALASALFSAPDFLLLDEPTNNLDADGRAMVARLLSEWRGGAIVVSHDRALLETMDAIIELTSLGATRYGGNWSHYKARKALELAAAQADLDHADKQIGEAARKARLARERQDRRDASGSRKGAKGDMPRIVAGQRRQQAEASTGESRKLSARLEAQAREQQADARARIEIREHLAIALAPSGLPANAVVLALENVTAGHDPAVPLLKDFSLSIVGPERIAIAGPNGSGKTSLLRLITGALKPFSGRVHVGRTPVLLDQTVSILNPALSVRDNYGLLNPGASENSARSSLAHFLFRGDAALQIAGTLSGGQLLRAGLACTLGDLHPPQLLILDEPTNHLDIESIEAIEAALSAYDGALLLVSHDLPFLEAVGVERHVRLRP